MRPTLDELGIKHSCDKASKTSLDWQWPMGYLDTYDRLFTPWRDEPIRLLELGWGEYDPQTKTHDNPNLGGRSAAMWREYFTHAEIHIIDIAHKNNTVHGVHLHCGDQTDRAFLNTLSGRHGPFDIIVDDASHISSKTITSFEILWPHLNGGGYYAVEDLHSSYHGYYFGDTEASANPQKPCRAGNPTAMQYFLQLTHDVNYRGLRLHGPWQNGHQTTEWDCYPQQFWRGHAIESVHYQYQLCVIRKR